MRAILTNTFIDTGCLIITYFLFGQKSIYLVDWKGRQNLSTEGHCPHAPYLLGWFLLFSGAYKSCMFQCLFFCSHIGEINTIKCWRISADKVLTFVAFFPDGLYTLYVKFCRRQFYNILEGSRPPLYFHSFACFHGYSLPTTVSF